MRAIKIDGPEGFAGVVKSYLRHLTGQQRADRTRDEYSYVLAALGRFLTSQECDSITHMGLEHLQDYLEDLRRVHGVDSGTLAHHHIIITQWLKYLRIRDLCPLSPSEMTLWETEKPKARRRKAVVDWQGVERMLLDLSKREAPADAPIHWWRDRAIYAMLFSTALRVSELVALNRDALAHETVVVIGKGDKAREVPISEDAAFFARMYCSLRRDLNPALFARHDLKPDQPVARLSVRSVQKLMERDREYYGVAGLTPHKIRHLAGTILYKATGNIELVRSYMGHASVSTTSGIYLHVEDEFTLASVRTYHPAFRKKKGV